MCTAPPLGSHLVLGCGGWPGFESAQETMRGMWVGPGENQQSAVRPLPHEDPRNLLRDRKSSERENSDKKEGLLPLTNKVWQRLSQVSRLFYTSLRLELVS